MSKLLLAVPLALILSVSVCQAVEAPFRFTWWCGSAYATRPDEASINVNYSAQSYPAMATLPEVHAYSWCEFLSSLTATNAPTLKNLSSARFVWTSEASGGNVTKGARIYLGAGAKLPVDNLANYDTLRVYAWMKVNETDRIDEIHFGYQTNNDSADMGALDGSLTGDDTWSLVWVDAAVDFTGDNSLFVTMNITGTDTSGNVGLTQVDVAYIAFELIDT